VNLSINVRAGRAWPAIAVVASCIAVAAIALLWRAHVSDRGLPEAGAVAGGGRFAWPWRPSIDEQFPASTECARCHPTQAEQWSASAHARASTDPLVHAAICGRCHTPLGTQFDAEYQLKLYDRTPMPGLPAAAAEGVTCVTCHSTAHVPEDQILTFLPTWPNWRGTDLALETLAYDTARGTFGEGTIVDPAPVPNESHASQADPRLSSSDLCRPCHEVVVDKEPLAPHCGLSQARVQLLTTYSEWAASTYAIEGKSCQSCHMARDEALGTAAVAPPGTEYDRPLPPRPLADHTLAGVSTEYLTTGPLVDQQGERAAAHVKDAAALAVTTPSTIAVGADLMVSVAITNTGAGHDLPTGFAYWSETWLEVTAADADGRMLFASGDLDDEGWLRDEFNPRVLDGTAPYDEYLVSLRARLVAVGPNRARWQQADGTLLVPLDDVARNRNGTPIIGTDGDAALEIVRNLYPGAPAPVAGLALQEGYVLRFADTVLRAGIPARASRQARYVVPVAATVSGPIRVSARLLMRALWPWMLQQQEELPTPRPRPRIYEIAAAEGSVSVIEP